MKITRLTGTECNLTRNLWESVFQEDSRKFVDYYYEQKAKDNIAYVTGEEPYEAMLFRTPYPVQIQDKLKELSYLVGVATREEYRHNGRMTALLMTAMQEMYKERLPFTFLMPADPAIYDPFDFSYVYERPQWNFQNPDFPIKVLEPLIGTRNRWMTEGEEANSTARLKAAEGGQGKELKAAAVTEESGKEPRSPQLSGYELSSLTGRCADHGEEAHRLYQRLADYANHWLEQRHRIYVKRDCRYYERQLAELQAQNGDIFLLEREGELEGFFLYAREGQEIAVQEMMETVPGSFWFIEEKEEKKPIIMARIIHLEEMMKLVKSSQNRAVLIDVEDPILPQNEGRYLWEITPFGSRVSRQKEVRGAEVYMTIKELTPYLIQGAFLNEIV